MMSERLKVSSGDGDDVYALPTSFAQQRMWFHEQMEPGTPAYNVPQLYWLEGALDERALERALATLVARHEALRTSFAMKDGEPLQILATKVPFSLRRADVSSAAPTERRHEAQRLVDEDARTPFKLAEAPLFRALLVRLSEVEHALLLNAHHIVVDGSSLAILLGELSELYRAFSTGTSPTLSDPTIQYADFAIWQKDFLQGEELERQLAYWTKQLAQPLPVVELPGDRPRSVATLNGKSFWVSWPKAFQDAVASLSKQEGAPAFAVLHAAFSAFLHRILGLEDVVVGSAIATRDRAETHGSVGLYTNTLVFRTKPASTMTFRELVRQAKDVVLDGLAHQDLPIEKIAQALKVDRSAGYNPLFQVMLNAQRAPEAALSLPGVKLTLGHTHSGTAKFDLLFEVQDTDDGYQCFVELGTDRFEEATMRRLVGAFGALAEHLLASPDATLGSARLLTERDEAQILALGTGPERVYPKERGLHEHALAGAPSHPDRAAVIFEGTTLTYGELDTRSTAVAHALAEAGVGKGALVGVCLERSPALVIALLGVLKAGAAYVPIDPRYPEDRVEYMLEDSGAAVVVTQESLLSRAAAKAKPVLLDAAGRLASAPEPRPLDRANGAAPAYVIYTSGSTGKPKGVRVPHGAVVNFLVSMAEEPGLGEGDRLLAVTTISFDIAGLELFLPLSVGATLVLATQEDAGDGERLRSLVDEHHITVLQATPTTFRMLVEAGLSAPDRLRVLSGGEALPPALVDQLRPRVHAIWNMYGPTETTIWSTCQRIETSANITIGKPIANTRVYVLDGERRLLPLGVPGELYIGGDGVAVDYLGRPELTAERFVADPFAGGSARMYRTGDVVRLREDGTLEYLGRNDFQVKLRGYRIELGEIEAALGRNEAVRQAVVAVKPDPSGDKRLVAYVAFQRDEVTASELRKHLRAALPEYMVPHLFVPLDALPLTSNGKIDRKALPDPFAGASAQPREHVPPRTELERIIAEIWKDVLKVEAVGLYDNFFDLGGHSLLSMQAIHRIEQRTGARIQPRSFVFDNLEQVAAAAGAASVLPSTGRAAAPDEAAAAPAAADDALSSDATSAPSKPPTPSTTPRAGDDAPSAGALARKVFGALKRRVLGP